LDTGIRKRQRRLNLLLGRRCTGSTEKCCCIGQAGADGFLLTGIGTLRGKDGIGRQ